MDAEIARQILSPLLVLYLQNNNLAAQICISLLLVEGEAFILWEGIRYFLIIVELRLLKCEKFMTAVELS